MPSAPKWLSDTLVKLMGSRMPVLIVKEVEDFNAHIRKITFEGDLSTMDFLPGYAVMVRVSDTEMRNYTVYSSDKKNGWFETIANIHGEAPGSNLMKTLKSGDEIRISCPRGNKYYDPNVKKQLVFGDETSLALAKSYFEVFKENKHDFQFYLELDEANMDIPEKLGLENVTIFPKNETFRNLESISKIPIFDNDDWADANYILSGNVTTMQNFKKSAKNQKYNRQSDDQRLLAGREEGAVMDSL